MSVRDNDGRVCCTQMGDRSRNASQLAGVVVALVGSAARAQPAMATVAGAFDPGDDRNP
jgi:hypothetical protein